MNRSDLQRLADDRVADAAALLAAGRWSAAYYLAGYAVECGLKACIARRVRAEDFPDKKLANDSYTHNLEALVGVADLAKAMRAEFGLRRTFERNWLAVSDWSEAARYSQRSEVEARQLVAAVADVPDGILVWLKVHW